MKTKNTHTNTLLDRKAPPIVQLYYEFSQLKNLYRQGWLKRGVSEKDCETVAEHKLGVVFLGFLFRDDFFMVLSQTVYETLDKFQKHVRSVQY